MLMSSPINALESLFSKSFLPPTLFAILQQPLIYILNPFLFYISAVFLYELLLIFVISGVSINTHWFCVWMDFFFWKLSCERMSSVCELCGVLVCPFSIVFDWSPCSIRNFTIRFMPIPIIDASQALKANPEKTEDALLKVCLFIVLHKSACIPKRHFLEPKAAEPIKHAYLCWDEESPFSSLPLTKRMPLNPFSKDVPRIKTSSGSACFLLLHNITYTNGFQGWSRNCVG